MLELLIHSCSATCGSCCSLRRAIPLEFARFKAGQRGYGADRAHIEIAGNNPVFKVAPNSDLRNPCISARFDALLSRDSAGALPWDSCPHLDLCNDFARRARASLSIVLVVVSLL